ncbi:MAG TPA: hypothetical protein VF120_10190 [Ktedonobacterales bacterium]
MSDEQGVAKTNPVPERDQDNPLKDRLHESPVPDNRLSGEQMPLTEAAVGYGNEGPERTVAGEDNVDYRPAPSAPQFGPAISGDTGPAEDTHEIGSYAEGGSHNLGNRQTELLDKQGGRTMTGYPDYYRPEEQREQ